MRTTEVLQTKKIMMRKSNIFRGALDDELLRDVTAPVSLSFRRPQTVFKIHAKHYYLVLLFNLLLGKHKLTKLTP